MSTWNVQQIEIPPVSTNDMVSVEASRERFRCFMIWCGCFALVFFAGVLVRRCTHHSGDTSKVIMVRTTRGPFVHEVVGRGNVESSSNVSITSEVEGKTTIVSLIPEGSWVKAGDVIAQLDPQTIETRMELYQMWKENAPLELQNIRATFQENEALLEEYLCGTVKAKRLEIEYAIAKTRNSLVESSRLAKSSEHLVRAGYTTDTQLEVDRIAVRKNANSLKKSLLDQDVLLRYSSEKHIVELVSKAETARTNFATANKNFAFVIERLKRLEEQFNACVVRAPRDGRVVYANQRLRPGMSETEIIQEGASVRKSQVMFRIPDPNQMQVRALVNENAILRVKEGMKVVLVFDVLRKRSFEGVVAKVNHFPELIPWDTRKRFAVLTEIKNPQLIRQAGVDLRSGLSADVRIVVQERRDSVIVPLHALVASGDKQYCLTRHLGIWQAKEVLVEGTNASQASVIDGLKGRETIIAGAKRYLDRVTLPDPEAPSVFGDRLKKLNTHVASGPKTSQQKNNAKPKGNASGKRPPEIATDTNGPSGSRSADKASPENDSSVPDVSAIEAVSTPGDLVAANVRRMLDKQISKERSGKTNGLVRDRDFPDDLSDEERIRLHEQKYAPIKKYLNRSTIKFCLEFDSNGDDKVTRSEIKKVMPEFGAYFDEWDRNHNGLWEYTEIAFGLYKVRFSTGKEDFPVSADSSSGKAPRP